MATKEKKSPKSEAKKAVKAEKAPKPQKQEDNTEAAPEQVDMADDATDEMDGKPSNSTKRKAGHEEIEIDVSAPEPPSKRARRALKKGKPVASKADSDDEKKDGKKEGRSEHGVWIGNLPFTVTPQELRVWLIDNSGGVILDDMITRVKLPTSKEPGRDKSAKPANKGFAYVDFNDVGPKVAAIALSETELSSRKLLIKDARSFEGRPKKDKEDEPEAAAGEGGQGQQPAKKETNASRKIFVGNMSFKTTEEDVRRNFEKCGEIDWAKVATFEDTGKCKGFGWVMFRESEAAAWAVKGFVKIKEAIETEDDFKDGGDDDDDDDDDADADADNDAKKKQQQQQKQFKTRKWWVNRMLGRELKIELAEDDQARYKKRFGKDRPKPDGDNPRGRPPARRNHGEGSAASASGPKPRQTAEDLQVARLTASVVEHTGSKMTFD